jgi:hypothetical protein
VPRAPTIILGPPRGAALEQGFALVVVLAGNAERIVQVGSPLRGGNQPGLNQRESVEEPRAGQEAFGSTASSPRAASTTQGGPVAAPVGAAA